MKFRIRAQNNQGGFTLMELLVVMAIIGVLMAAVVMSVRAFKSKGNDARRQQDIQQIQNALNLYRNDFGYFPASGGATSPNNQWTSSNDNSWNTLETALAPYIKSLPKDPINTATGGWAFTGSYTYSYYSLGGGCNQLWYVLVYKTEATSNPASPGVKDCNGTSYNYGNGTVTVGAAGK